MAPARVIQGQSTHLSRTTHGIAYDTTHDEIVAPNPLAAAVVIFRGGATGEEAPVRTIQGARSGLSRPETVAVDEMNDEIYVGDPGDRRVLVYKRDADGDAEPLRTIQGHKTKLLQIVGISVDPVRDLLVVSTYSRLAGGVTGPAHLQAHRRAATSRRSASSPGPKTGITRLRQIGLDPATGHIFVAAINNEYLPPYDVDKPRAGLAARRSICRRRGTPAARASSACGTTKGDDGDVPPHSLDQRPIDRHRPSGGRHLQREGRRGHRPRRGLERPVHVPEAGALPDTRGTVATMIRRLLAILGRRTMLTFGLVTFMVGALLATVNITSRYALEGLRRRSAEAHSVGPRRLPERRRQRRPYADGLHPPHARA